MSLYSPRTYVHTYRNRLFILDKLNTRPLFFSITNLKQKPYSFVFSDVGIVQSKFLSENHTHQYASVGASMLYETKNGVIKLTYAVGNREDLKFNWRGASKLHVGYINYF